MHAVHGTIVVLWCEVGINVPDAVKYDHICCKKSQLNKVCFTQQTWDGALAFSVPMNLKANFGIGRFCSDIGYR